MKSKNHLFLFRPLTTAALCALAPLHAATIDTTGTTVVLNASNPENTYIGNGTLEVSGGEIKLDTDSSHAITEFAMTGGLINIVSATSLVNGGWAKGVWTKNRAGMQVDGSFDLNDGNPVIIDALTGSGTVTKTYWNPSSSDTRTLTVGQNGGSGTFSGIITQANAIHIAALTKNGGGTQILTGANDYTGATTINGGTLQIGNGGTSGTLGSGAVTIASGALLAFNRSDDYGTTYNQSFSGGGAITKSGLGTLTLSGNLTHNGTTTVSAGTLVASNGFSGTTTISIASGAILGIDSVWSNDTAAITLASGAKVNLNFTGTGAVGIVSIAGVGTLPVGTYNSATPTYGGYFTGGGSLKITTASGSSTWTASGDGNWSDDTNWQGNIVPTGYGTATFNAGTGAIVTLDSPYTIGNLVFGVSGYTLAGANLTLKSAGSLPTATVATGISASIESVIDGTTGLVKNGGGTLTLTAANLYTGATTVAEGTLVASNGFTNATAVSVASGATLRIDQSSGEGHATSFSGSGTLVFNPGIGNSSSIGWNPGLTIQMGASGLIRVQSGIAKQGYGFTYNWGGNQAGMTIDSGAAFDVWDGGGINIDALNGGGTLQKTYGAWNTTNVNIGQAGGSGTFSGTIITTDGSINLIKNGSGTQAFTGTTTFSGSLVVNQGILSLGNGTTSTSLADTGPVSIANGAKLNLNFTGSDTVGSVKLGDTTYTAPGNYNATTYPAFFTGGGSLVIPGADPFADWMTTNYSGIVSPNNQPGADPDNDGISNLMEYVLKDGNPSVSSTGTLPTANASGANFVFTYFRRAAATGTTQTFEYGSTLSESGRPSQSPAVPVSLSPIRVAASTRWKSPSLKVPTPSSSAASKW